MDNNNIHDGSSDHSIGENGRKRSKLRMGFLNGLRHRMSACTSSSSLQSSSSSISQATLAAPDSPVSVNEDPSCPSTSSSKSRSTNVRCLSTCDSNETLSSHHRSGSFKRRRRVSSGQLSQFSLGPGLAPINSPYASRTVSSALSNPPFALDLSLTFSGLHIAGALESPTELDEATVDEIDRCHPIFTIPEILLHILSYVDSFNSVPHESAPRRRKPLSLRHAILLHGDTPATHRAWEKSQREAAKAKTREESDPAGLYSCLLVNKQWYSVAVEVLHKKLYFSSTKRWNSFVSEGTRGTDLSSQLLVLHKITGAQQQDINDLGFLGGNLKLLEFYTCPNIVPTKALLGGGRLTKIVLPGCSKVDDRIVALIAEQCPQLEYLDLRACDLVSDRGLKALAKHCRDLKLLNVGRTQNGELITYRGVKHIARRTSIVTLGLAGTSIDDRTIMELVRCRGPELERLSLNNCQLLTNNSVPRMLVYTTKLSVLELRGCPQITDLRPIVLFKRHRERIGRPPLIEGCELFELRMKEAEWLVEMEVSRAVFRDCLEWIYSADDDKEPHQVGLTPLKLCDRNSGAQEEDFDVTTTTM
uniref:ARAD1C20790p n=1 Tax=Blastobotrys adeninivorans TaxID=409370 RepID=A0A060T6K2_BLAAD